MPLVKVLYWAQAREIVGTNSEVLHLPRGSTVAKAWDTIVQKHGELNLLKKQIRLAVNREVVDDSYELNEGDEVALLPAVAGG